MSNVSELIAKWGPLLEDADFDSIPADRKGIVAQMLENSHNESAQQIRRDPTLSLSHLMEAAPANSMGTSATPSTVAAGGVDIYDPVMINLLRRAAPNLIAYDVCGVQPMTGPTGLIFALRSRYENQSGLEALFNEANTAFGSANTTAVGTDPTLYANASAYSVGRPMSTALGEALGGNTTHKWSEMAFSIERIPVTAKERALKGSYTHELASDLKNVHGLDAEGELTQIMSRELLAEINREIIRTIYTTASVGAQQNVASAGTFDLDLDSNGRWMVEKFKGIVMQIEIEANAIAKATRAGKGNVIITSADVASALAMAGVLKTDSDLAKDSLVVDDTGNTFAGVLLGRYKVFIDPYAISSTGQHAVTIGYKGASQWNAGLFYCPYVPLQLYKAMSPDSLQPVLGFKTRYGLVASPFATAAADGDVNSAKKNLFYRIFKLKNLL